MKKYISKFKNLTIYSGKGTIKFVNGEYVARSAHEIKIIEGTDLFGKTVFAVEEKRAEEVQKKETTEQKEGHVCEICGAQFTTPQGLLAHSRVHK